MHVLSVKLHGVHVTGSPCHFYVVGMAPEGVVARARGTTAKRTVNRQFLQVTQSL